jgi:outer membrane protein OmpA-like peptidoglycan-associated protein
MSKEVVNMRVPVLPLLAVSLAVSGCASKKYVSREVGEINQKVEAVAAEVEKTQQRVKENEVRIEAVDKNAQSGITEAKGSAQKAMAKAVEAERAAKGKLLYTVTLSNDKVTFPVNHAEVSEDAKKIIDEAIGPFVAENRGVFFEIEGHTDATGPEEYNLKLGEERAMAVRNYLYNRHKIALSRIEVISYGESQPVVDNKTREARAHNRRVVIKVLE